MVANLIEDTRRRVSFVGAISRGRIAMQILAPADQTARSWVLSIDERMRADRKREHNEKHRREYAANVPLAFERP